MKIMTTAAMMTTVKMITDEDGSYEDNYDDYSEEEPEEIEFVETDK